MAEQAFFVRGFFAPSGGFFASDSATAAAMRAASSTASRVRTVWNGEGLPVFVVHLASTAAGQVGQVTERAFAVFVMA
ncbi:MAG: hypothetical protein Q4G50_08875 [Corynebacterium sp.]|uniref:hypothetical protein n=1 Tax=Corynebacterium sp. TaxID=1720 RepID=UPI0026DF194C|nr:hypothetical protein [Corynebacterium sp.]MDO5670102.1 hypothetical protein [Corynebacterium sp.]